MRQKQAGWIGILLNAVHVKQEDILQKCASAPFLAEKENLIIRKIQQTTYKKKKYFPSKV